jgi:hypothetical protein
MYIILNKAVTIAANWVKFVLLAANTALFTLYLTSLE